MSDMKAKDKWYKNLGLTHHPENGLTDSDGNLVWVMGIWPNMLAISNGLVHCPGQPWTYSPPPPQTTWVLGHRYEDDYLQEAFDAVDAVMDEITEDEPTPGNVFQRTYEACKTYNGELLKFLETIPAHFEERVAEEVERITTPLKKELTEYKGLVQDLGSENLELRQKLLADDGSIERFQKRILETLANRKPADCATVLDVKDRWVLRRAAMKRMREEHNLVGDRDLTAACDDLLHYMDDFLSDLDAIHEVLSV